MYALLGFLCYAFAVIDFAGMFFGYDLTGVSWSPIAASFIGTMFFNAEESDEKKEQASR